jgi:hypothetical protein
MGRTIELRGQHVIVLESERPKERTPDKFYYGIRHEDSDLDMPITLEPSVVVNYWGTIVCDKPIDLGPEGYVALTEGEQDLLLDRW